MILGMGVMELSVIFIVALLVFGPRNLPKLGSMLGKTVKNIRVAACGDACDQKTTPQTDLAASVCPRCGRRNSPDNAYCVGCGKKL